jgi:uncharacterized membrane protein YsdA (DUF1294 family)
MLSQLHAMNSKSAPIRFYCLVFIVLALALVGLAGLAIGVDRAPLVIWLVASNVAAFIIWGFDKSRARRGEGRVPEMTLHLMALAGATPASFLAMWTFRHKTLQTRFKVLYVIFLAIQAWGFIAWRTRA